MEADWEVEVGGGAPVIEALWPGFVDLRASAERIGEIVEAANYPALGSLLRKVNAVESLLWTSKCDLWQPDSSSMACYLDLLPREGLVFSGWRQAESLCREWVTRLSEATLNAPAALECRVELVVRQAIAGSAEGFGVTAYLSARCLAAGCCPRAAAEALAETMVALAETAPLELPPETDAAKLQ